MFYGIFVHLILFSGHATDGQNHTQSLYFERNFKFLFFEILLYANGNFSLEIVLLNLYFNWIKIFSFVLNKNAHIHRWEMTHLSTFGKKLLSFFVATYATYHFLFIIFRWFECVLWMQLWVHTRYWTYIEIKIDSFCLSKANRTEENKEFSMLIKFGLKYVQTLENLNAIMQNWDLSWTFHKNTRLKPHVLFRCCEPILSWTESILMNKTTAKNFEV